MTGELDPSKRRLFTPFSDLGMYLLLTIPTARAICKGATLREQCFETRWTVYVTEPCSYLHINFENSGVWRSTQPKKPKESLRISKLPHLLLTNLECSVPVFRLFLSSGYRASFKATTLVLPLPHFSWISLPLHKCSGSCVLCLLLTLKGWDFFGSS